MSRFWFIFFIKGVFKSLSSTYFVGVTNISCPSVGMKLLGGPVSTDQKLCRDFSFKRVSKTIVLTAAVSKLNDPQYELLLLCNCAGVGRLSYAHRTCFLDLLSKAQLQFDLALCTSLERIVTASGPGFGDC